MKILSVTWKIFEIKDNEYVIAPNGGSVMITNICEYIGRKESSYLLTGMNQTPEMSFGHIHVIDNKHYLPLKRTKENINEWHEGLLLQFDDIIAQVKPDFVFVHGGGDFSYNILKRCMERNIPSAFVDHQYLGNKGCNFFHESVLENESRILSIPNLNIICVGKGMRDRILKENPQINRGKIFAIPNGVAIPEVNNFDEQISSLKTKYNLDDKFIIGCIGRLCCLKNQIQVIRAFSLLPEKLKKQIAIVFCGPATPDEEKKVMDTIREYNLEEYIIYIGVVSINTMNIIYLLIDGLISASYLEGLSMVVLEAISYGKPAIMFNDNETASDVNDSIATIIVKERNDQALANAIERMKKQAWDKEAIINYSKNFSMERVADNYIRICKNILNNDETNAKGQ